MTMINLRNLSKIFPGSSTPSVDQLDLQIDEGELLCLLGPSGCGKSTTLRMIAGLETPTTGRIEIRDATVDDVASGTRVPAERRDLGLVFQNYALWPHLKVRDNVGFGPTMQRVSKAERIQRVDDALTTLGIDDYADRYPSELSGGQQQRVAIARTLAARPSVMLLDEPLSNLDARLRLEMRAEFQRIHREVGLNMVFVTHDQWESMTMATRIVVMNQGRIEQTGTPLEIYQRPVSRFVAEFMGSPPINMIELADGTQSATTQMLQRYLGRQRNDAASVGIRPEALHFTRDPADAPGRCCGTEGDRQCGYPQPVARGLLKPQMAPSGSLVTPRCNPISVPAKHSPPGRIRVMCTPLTTQGCDSPPGPTTRPPKLWCHSTASPNTFPNQRKVSQDDHLESRPAETGLPCCWILAGAGQLYAPQGWERHVAQLIVRLLDGHPQTPSLQRITADVTAGAIAAKSWRNAMSRPFAPPELSHESYVLDFIAADWPAAVRQALPPHCAAICYAVNEHAEHRTLRNGSAELLRWAATQQLPVVIVSNALSGAVHRDYLSAAGLTEFVTAELYSDELGIRKPNPELLIQGAAAARGAGVAMLVCRRPPGSGRAVWHPCRHWHKRVDG